MKSRKAGPSLIEYAEALGFKFLRKTTGGRRAQLIHKENGQIVTVPIKSINEGREVPNFQALIRRKARRNAAKRVR